MNFDSMLVAFNNQLGVFLHQGSSSLAQTLLQFHLI